MARGANEEFYSEKVRARRAPPGLDLENALILSDFHANHGNIIKYAGRPADWQEGMLEWWKSVPEEQPVLHLGDWFMGPRGAFPPIARALGGRNFTLLGNHDDQPASFYEELGIRVVKPFTWLHAGWTVVFIHRPAPEAVQQPKSLCVHGHIHQNLMADRRFINVSVEHTGYRGVRLLELVEARIAELSGGE